MNAPLIPESEDFLYWDPETIQRYPDGLDEQDRPDAENQAVGGTLARQALLSLLAATGAGLLSALALSALVLVVVG